MWYFGVFGVSPNVSPNANTLDLACFYHTAGLVFPSYN